MKRALFLSLFLLSACGGHLEKAGITQEQLEADKSACSYEVDKASASAPLDNPIESGMREGMLWNDCMKQKGYKKVN